MVFMLEEPSPATRRIRVALILYRDDSTVGGSLRVAQLFGNHLDQKRIDPHFIFVYGGPGPVSTTARVPVHFVNARGAGDLRGWLSIRRMIDDLKPDILHFMNPVFWANLALWDWRGPRLNHIHGPLPDRLRGIRDRITFSAFRFSMTKQICVSKSIEQQAIDIGAGKPEKLCTIYNAIDCAAFAVLPPRANARTLFKLPEEAYVLGMVCRLVHEKGCADGIRLMQHLPADFHLVICGSGPQEEKLRRIVADLDVQSRVHFLGTLDMVTRVYAAIDSLLFLSRNEPFGLILAEAMAAGVPIVGIVGQGGYSDPGHSLVKIDNSILLPPDEPFSTTKPASDALLAKLAIAINTLRNSPDLGAAMTDRAKHWVNQQFAIQRSADDLANLYSAVMASTN